MIDYGLSSQQLAVICALSSGATVTEAAGEAGVHRNTITNWRRNLLPFQYAFAHAQYDRALHYREKIEELVDLAIATLQQILTDPNASAAVRLKAALAIIQTATTPPPPKKQVELDIEKVTVTEKQLGSAPLEPPATVHNSAQQPALSPIRRDHPKVGRNEPCPCQSGLKYKRCCLDKPPAAQSCTTTT